ncbi:MAG: tRNA (adenosine(37)-N6)-threonylcarbamoyltransferase complex ATPase subunit type 1 TsaE [Clostridia bacterium]|nr:tRNA (adenosine(37)-N6)-threonylcarbamoyltransferase complex ATPase subunit type 1 TsaE [Clostridia bacterium]
MKTVQCGNVSETEAVGRELAKAIDGAGIRSAVIAMFGEMGVGKTAFTRGFSSYFGIPGVKSPTYTVVNEYRGGGTSVFHFDMYRIEGEDDLYSIGFDDYLAKPGYCIIEWSENIREFLPDGYIAVTVSRTDGADGRKIGISLPDGLKEKVIL